MSTVGANGRSPITMDDISRQVNIHPSIAEKIIADFVRKGVLMKFSVEGEKRHFP